MASKDLIELCAVLYHEDMKAHGLNNLAKCYNEWLAKESFNETQEQPDAE